MPELKIKSIAQAFHYNIFELDEAEANRLIDKHLNKESYSCEEKSLFIIKHKDGTVTGLDNTTGDCYCEDFKIESDAFIWLLGLKEVEPLHAAEEIEGWW